VPYQGLDLGYVIAKRPPLSDFAFNPTRIFKIDKAVGLEEKAIVPARCETVPAICFGFEERPDFGTVQPFPNGSRSATITATTGRWIVVCAGC